MRKTTTLTILAIMLATTLGLAATAQGATIAGIVLGEPVGAIKSRVDFKNALPMWDRPYMSRAKLSKTMGFKSGYVEFGTCTTPNRILRIKLKYKDDSLDFFVELLKAMSAKYGKPVEWRGNASGTVKGYKWSKMLDGQQVNITLLRSVTDDTNYTKGNSIRISLPKGIEQELKCAGKEPSNKKKPFGPKNPDMDWYLP